MANVIGYLRVSTEKQDIEKQRHLLLEFANKEKLHIAEFIEVEASTRKSSVERRIDYLKSRLEIGSVLLVAELSRLERSMVDCINLVTSISEMGVKIKFVRQPELDTGGIHGKLILAIFGYFAETEREYIRMRTKQGLEAAKANGKVLGRPKGCRNKRGLALDPFKDEIQAYMKLGLPVESIRKIINGRLGKSFSYNTYSAYVKELIKSEGKFSDKITRQN